MVLLNTFYVVGGAAKMADRVSGTLIQWAITIQEFVTDYWIYILIGALGILGISIVYMVFVIWGVYG